LFFDEEISNDNGEPQQGQNSKGVYTAIIKTPLQDSYKVETVAPPGEHYSVAVYGSDRGAGLKYDLFDGTSVSGRPSEYSFNYSPEPGAQTMVLQVPIDIKPKDDKNIIKCKDKDDNKDKTDKDGEKEKEDKKDKKDKDDRGEEIPVAILSTNTFNALDVDADSVVFEGARETHVDKKTGRAKRHEEDVNGDGKKDLIFHFRRSDTTLLCGDNIGNLHGLIKNGMEIKGSDQITFQK
jgi:hypothetical protein